MTRVPSLAAVLIGSVAVSACIVVPRTESSYDPDCRITTHRMTLDTVQVGRINDCSYKQDCVAIVLGLGVTAASAIVSGSIAVMGNVAYWAERQAGCALVAPAPERPGPVAPAAGPPSA